MMLKGKAVGGPRDGVVLTAGSTWDGKVHRLVRHKHSDGCSYSVPFPGRYSYTRIDGGWAWVWKGNEETPDSRTQL